MTVHSTLLTGTRRKCLKSVALTDSLSMCITWSGKCYPSVESNLEDLRHYYSAHRTGLQALLSTMPLAGKKMTLKATHLIPPDFHRF